MNKRVVGETKEEDLSVKLATWMRGVDGLKKEWEGMKIGKHGMVAHAKVERQCWRKRWVFDSVSGVGSNEVVPPERFDVGVGKMKTWVRV